MNRIKENCGEKIQDVANSVRIFGWMLSILIGTLSLLSMGIPIWSTSIKAIIIIFGAIIMCIGCFLTWLISEMLEGFADVVTNTAENATYYEELYNNLMADTKEKTK